MTSPLSLPLILPFLGLWLSGGPISASGTAAGPGKLLCPPSTCAVAPSEPMQEPGYRYTRRINNIWGTAPDLATLSENQRLELGRASLDRATLLGDAYEFALRVGTDYAAWRDTAQAVERTSGAAVYRGIHLALNGEPDQARSVLQRALAGAQGNSESVGPLARDWMGFLAGTADDVWESRFLSGRDVSFRSCEGLPQGSARMARCNLAVELTTGDVAAVARRQRALLADPSPDHVDMGGRYLEVAFHDPLRLLILARADGWVAHEVLSRRTEPAVQLASARGLIRAGAYEAAELVLRELDGNIAAAERGVALYAAGAEGRALEIWSALESRGGDAELLALEAASRFGLSGDRVRSRALSEVETEFQALSVARALLLGRALLRAGEGELALAVLASQYRRSWHNDLSRVPAEMLLLLAHAKYLSGRDHYAEAREHMVVLSREDAVLGGILTMLQELTAPERPTSDRSRTGGA